MPKTPKTHSKRLLSLLAAPVAGVCLSAGFVLPGPAAAATATPPPELAPLLAKMNELQLSSERFSGEVVFGGRLPRKLTALSGLKLQLSGELSSFPPAATVTTTADGKSLTLRVVNKTIYIRDASIAARDGGRPWLEENEQSINKLLAANPNLNKGTGLGSSATAGEFKETATLVSTSKDIRSLGTSTIEGQSVTGFAGKVDPRKLEESELPSSIKSRLDRVHALGAIEIFIAANGLPVRTVLELAFDGVRMDVTENVLAEDYPVVAIVAPPASETISAAEAVKLEQAAKKSKKK
jgi:hypothetical protein